MSKLPEMPNFLNKDKEEVPSVKKEETIQVDGNEPPPIPSDSKKQQPPVKPNGLSKKKEDSVEKKSWFFKKNNKIEDANQEVTPVAPKENKSFKEIFIQSLVVVVGLGLIGATVHYYLQYKKYEDKYVAIDSKVLALTKQIISLNQENNQLSGKVVNYQKELENVKEVETNSEALQDKLIKNETEKKDLETKIQALQDYVVEMENKAKEVVKPNKGKNISKKLQVNKPIFVEKKEVVKTVTPVPTTENKETTSVKKEEVPVEPAKQVETKTEDQLFDYETNMVSEKQIKCKQYFRDETLKRCNDTNKSFDYTLTTIVRKVKLNDQEVSKLVYKCVSPTAKDRLFKYGPLELSKTCKE